MDRFELRGKRGEKRKKPNEDAERTEGRKKRKRGLFSGRSMENLFKNCTGFHLYYSEISKEVIHPSILTSFEKHHRTLLFDLAWSDEGVGQGGGR